MITDKYGQIALSENEICELYLKEPTYIPKEILSTDDIPYNSDLELEILPNIVKYAKPIESIEEFDSNKQREWLMPDEYKNFDIVKWVLEQCKNECELQRAGEELLLYQEKDLIMLLCYLKYLVDTMRKNNIVWGVGRGSSVASFVLFLIGIHRINSIVYDLDIKEFLR